MATPEKYAHINFKPPQGARKEAEKSLAWRREHGRGGTAVGIARARDLARGSELSPSTVRRMKAFFDRHQKNKSAPGWSPGEDGFPSNSRIAWAMWGSDAGWAWAKKVVEQMNAADEKESRSLRPKGSTHGIKPKIVVVHGPPCSGKAEYVAAHLGESDVVFDFDSVMSAISGQPRYQHSKPLVSYCLDIRTLILKKAMRGSVKAWVIVTRVTDEMRSQLSDVPVEYVRMDASREECLQKLEEDSARSQIAEELRKVIEEYFSEGEERRAVMPPGVERRFIGNFSNSEKLDPEMLRVERRSDPETGKPRTYIVGYAARFQRDSLLMGDFVEQIDPGAFEIVTNRQDEDGKPLETRCLFNHDPNHLLGRFPTTMRMTVDEKGLKYECLLPESRADLAESISRGDLKGSSFSFVVHPDGGEQWSYENGQSRRIVKKVKAILDCGPVTYPAYGDASVAVAKRSYEQFCETRDCGRQEGGKFGSGNECQKDGKGGGDTKKHDGGGLSATAKGAIAGAVIGGVVIGGAIPGAAIGAVIGKLSEVFGRKKDSLPKMSDDEAREKLTGMMETSNLINKTKAMTDDQLTSMVRAAGPEATFRAHPRAKKFDISKPDGSVFHVSVKGKGDATLTYGGKGQMLVGSNNTPRMSKPIDRGGVAEAERLAKSGGIGNVTVYVNDNDSKSQATMSSLGYSEGGQVGKGFRRYNKNVSSRRSYDDLVAFLAERRDCGRGNDGKFGSGNECQKDGKGGGSTKSTSEEAAAPPVGKKKSKYMELDPPLTEEQTKEAQDFVDDAREGQLSAGGKDGGKSDDGSGVQTWSKGDTYPWTVKQVGTDKGYVQGTHPDGSKTEKYPFENGNTKEADKLLRDELKKKNEKRVATVIEDTLKFLRERAR